MLGLRRCAWKLAGRCRDGDIDRKSFYPCPYFFRRHVFLQEFFQARKLLRLPHMRPSCTLFLI